jgi:hypothetical protein
MSSSPSSLLFLSFLSFLSCLSFLSFLSCLSFLSLLVFLSCCASSSVCHRHRYRCHHLFRQPRPQMILFSPSLLASWLCVALRYHCRPSLFFSQTSWSQFCLSNQSCCQLHCFLSFYRIALDGLKSKTVSHVLLLSSCMSVTWKG